MESEADNAPSSPSMVHRKHLSAIRQDSISDDLSTGDICTMFNEFLHEFEQMEKSGQATTKVFLDAVEEITDAVRLVVPYKLLDPRILYHPLLQFLYQMLVDIVHNWRSTNTRLNIQETDIFLKIILIFVHAAEQAPEPDAEETRKKIRDILATKRFLFLVQEQIDDIVCNKRDLNDDPNICTLGLLTIKLLHGAPFFFSAEKNQRLIDDLIINCLDSYDYLQAVRQLQHDQPLTDIDRFLLYTCWEYVPFSSAASEASPNKSKWIKQTQNLYDELLTRLERLLDEPPPIALPSITYIFERCRQILNIPNLSSFEKHANHIIDRLTNILQKQLSAKPQDEPLIIIALEAFHNLSENSDIAAIMRNHHLTSLFKNYSSTENAEQRKLAFGVLAEIMDEKEINKNPQEITATFIDQLKLLNPNEHNPDVDSTLSSLKGLMQHDQVKAEFIKQGGLEKLITFIRDGDPSKQSDAQLEDALNILWSCTFNNPEVAKKLQQDVKLMARVNQMQDNAKQDGNSSLEKAVEGFIWKVEKEEQFKEQQEAEADRKQKEKEEKKRKAQQSGTEVEEEEEEEEQYDMMLSYSWADMDLAHRIFHHLTDKLGYKIWLDQEQMHGSTIQAMANAVDNAQFILMCMSETYKKSANCQSEAEYAFNRKKHIVPLKMKKDYTADGWLGFILGTRLYIDFGTYEFEKAITLLDNEIQLQKKKRKDAKQVARAERQAAAVDDDDNRKEEKHEILNTKPATNVKGNSTIFSNWNEGNVRDFLMKHNLPSMLCLCDGINGEELSDLYEMCKTNPTSMYRSLKFELLHGYHRILPISTFLRFISRMRAAGDNELPSNTHMMKKIPEDHFPDDE